MIFSTMTAHKTITNTVMYLHAINSHSHESVCCFHMQSSYFGISCRTGTVHHKTHGLLNFCALFSLFHILFYLFNCFNLSIKRHDMVLN